MKWLLKGIAMARCVFTWMMLLHFSITYSQRRYLPFHQEDPSSVLLQERSTDLSNFIMPVVEIKQNRYAHWNLLISDTETTTSWFSGYRITDNGTAFGEEPMEGAFPGQESIKGYQGKYLANSKRMNLGTTIGKLVSDSFTIRGDRIDFLIAGGNFGKHTSLNLLIGDSIMKWESGDFSSVLKRKGWDVSPFKGQTARLLLVDDVSKDAYCTAPFDTLKDKYGFILVDDIRQTDKTGHQLDPASDHAHNFDFETISPSKYSITSTQNLDKANNKSWEFTVTNPSGKTIGKFDYLLQLSKVSSSLYQLNHEWSYRGDSIAGVKLRIINKIPISPAQTQFFVVPGLLYNGNNIGIRAHYLNEDFPEDAATIPGGFSVEDRTSVFGGWVQPQQNANDPRLSLELQKREKEQQWWAVYSLPFSANLALSDTMAQDEDHRLNIGNGFSLNKTTYLYFAPKKTFTEVSNKKAGYGQVVEEAWKQLYPQSTTNPPHSLTEDYRLKMHTLLDPLALVEKVKINDREYRLWIVGRFILGKDFDFHPFELVPTKYIFFYTGFSWSGMLETAAYNGIKEYIRTKDTTALNLAVHSLDFFADNGMSPIGILYPNWDSTFGFGSVWAKEQIDMGHLGDGLSGIIKCYQLMKENGLDTKSNWLNAVKTSLDHIMLRFQDGDVPGRIDGRTGQAVYREGILYQKPSLGGPNGINFLIWAFADYYHLTHEKKYLDYAQKMGDIVLYVLHKYGVMSGMEADYFNVDKRMFHGALAAFNRLYENTGNKKWLQAAQLAGNAFGSWEYCYNVNFNQYPQYPNGHFDYRSIGGTPVDVKFSTNNTNFQQGATEFLHLWNATGQTMWLERARAILHQGTQLSLTEEKRKWLNEHFQGPAQFDFMKSFNPTNTFDAHVLGGGTEDVMMSWLFKGIWTSKYAGIISMYMLTQGFDSDDLLQRYGSITYSYKWNNGGAIDMLDEVTMQQNAQKGILTIRARNMLSKGTVYSLKLLEYKWGTISVNGTLYHRKQIAAGIPIPFEPNEKKVIEIREDRF